VPERPPATSDRYRLSGIVGDTAAIARFDRFMAPENLVVGGVVTPHWLEDGASFRFASGEPPTHFRVDGATGERTKLAVAEPAAIVAPPRTFARASWLMLPKPAPEMPSADGCWFARLDDGDIRLRGAAGEADVALTADAIPGFGWDIDAPLFPLVGDPRGEWLPRSPWSPDGTTLFAIKYDRRSVADFPVYDRLANTSYVLKVPVAGAPMDIAHPHVIDVRSHQARLLELGDTQDHFFTLLGWLPGLGLHPDGSEVLFARHARNFKNVELLAGDPATGAVRTVIAERSDTFVAHQYEVIHYGDLHATIVPDGSAIVWRSARTGWNHFYLYGLDGTLQRALTAGEFPVIDVLAVDQSEGWLYFTAHHDQARPYDVHFCRVGIAGGTIERLTPRDGRNHICLSPSRQTFTVVNSRPDRPYRTDFHATDGRHLALVEQADVRALDALGYQAPEEFMVLAADGVTELWGVMYKPADFDPAKRYPLIDHLYAGPQLTQAEHHFGLGDTSRKRLDRALAQLGYIVVSLDARGTPGRSKAFQDVVYANLARHEIPDHVAAIRQLAARHASIDTDRIGVWGHSWGGYYAILAMAQAPETFRAGVAAAPTPDARYTFFSEPYLGLPSRAAAAYDHADLARWLPAITGKLLVAVGTADPLLDGIKITKGLIDAGVDHEFVVLPGAQHSFRDANDLYFIHKLVAHFETHLKGIDD
jgi:dipeptidyl-peptidase-4